MGRKEEIQSLLKLTPEEVLEKAGRKLVVRDDLDAIHEQFAKDLYLEMHEAADAEWDVNFILPVGPVGHYPILQKRINKEKLSIKKTRMFFLDEYATGKGKTAKAIPKDNPGSLRCIMQKNFFEEIDKGLGPLVKNIHFPDETNVKRMDEILEKAGGIDTCFAAIGPNGRLGFNEPESGIKETGARLVKLNDFTVSRNALGDFYNEKVKDAPKQAFTLGMRHILCAQKHRLYIRNGEGENWANAILRIALFAAPGDDYPVTYVRDKDFSIVADKNALDTPQ